MASFCNARKTPFLFGVFLIAFSVLIFQILQTRILSVIAWYYMAFFAISVAMLGMTVGSVWAYLRRESFESVPLPVTLSRFALLTAVAMPASMIVQFSLVTSVHPSLITAVAWSLLMAAMATPYVFSGVVVSLALTRSPFPVGQVYGVDLLGAALGCASVIGLLNLLDGPTAVIVAGAIAAFSALAFSSSYPGPETLEIEAMVATTGAGGNCAVGIRGVQRNFARELPAHFGQSEFRELTPTYLREMELLFARPSLPRCYGFSRSRVVGTLKPNSP